MINLRVQMRLLVLLVSVALTGCASVPMHEDLERIPRNPVKVDKPKVALKASECSCECMDEPGWNCVVYRGQVVDGATGEPVVGARVAVCEGKETLATTTSRSDGSFELACDLYGSPCANREGSQEWSPECYYSLVAEHARSGKGQCLLQSQGLTRPVMIRLKQS